MDENTTHHMSKLQPVRGAHGAAAWTCLRKGNSYWEQETQEVAWEGSWEDAQREEACEGAPKEKQEETWKKVQGEAHGRGHCWGHAGDALF